MGAGQTNPIRELDALRGLAALLVVLFHVPKWADFLHSNVVNNGYLMVDFFFVLSGFVISRAYGDRITTGRELVRFQFLRLGRVYPVHAVFLLLFVGIEAAGWRSAPVPGPASSDRLAAVVQHVFLVQAIGPTGNALTFNAPAWSISVELYAYLLFGLLALFTRTGRVAVLSLVALGSLAALAAGRGTGFEDWLRCLAGFSVGCLTSAAVGKARGRLPAWTPAAVLAAMALMLACRSSPAFHALMYVLAAALIAALVCGPEGRVHAALRHPALVALGEWSYSIYMSHYFVLWAVDTALAHMPGVTVESLPGGGRAVTLPTLAALAATGVSLLAVLGLSVLTHAWVEKPLRAWSRRVASPGRCG